MYENVQAFFGLNIDFYPSWYFKYIFLVYIYTHTHAQCFSHIHLGAWTLSVDKIIFPNA